MAKPWWWLRPEAGLGAPWLSDGCHSGCRMGPAEAGVPHETAELWGVWLSPETMRWNPPLGVALGERGELRSRWKLVGSGSSFGLLELTM